MLASVIAFAIGHTVTIAAVGDVMLARWVGRRIERQGPAAMLHGARSAFAGADVVYGNLECALTSARASARKDIVLHADPLRLTALKGFSVLSLVNNHALDCGQVGLADAVRRLRGAGIQPLEPAGLPETVQREGLRISFVGLMDLTGSHLPPAWRETVAKARRSCDVLIVGIHWGTEGTAIENPAQRAAATQLASAGVDAVLGCHPHVLQPLRVLPGPNGRHCLVAYSLGNFVFDSRPGPGRRSEILYLRVGRRGVTAYATRKCTIKNGFPTAAQGSLRWRNVK